jgi:hypothetical protein
VGSRRTGVPIEQAVDGWLDLRVARAALARERASLEKKEERTAAETAMRTPVSPLPPRSHTLPPKQHFGGKNRRLWKTRWQDVGKLAVLVNKKARDLRANFFVLNWLRGQDLNLRPLGYEPNELPDCSTPRHFDALNLRSRFAGS